MSMTGQICSHTTAACSPSRSLQKSACTTHRPAFTPPRHHLQQSHKLSRCSAQPTAEVRDRLAETGAVVSDQSVPEGHKGLHGFLYGEGGAEAHDSDARYNFREVKSALSCYQVCAGFFVWCGHKVKLSGETSLCCRVKMMALVQWQFLITCETGRVKGHLVYMHCTMHTMMCSMWVTLATWC